MLCQVGVLYSKNKFLYKSSFFFNHRISWSRHARAWPPFQLDARKYHDARPKYACPWLAQIAKIARFLCLHLDGCSQQRKSYWFGIIRLLIDNLLRNKTKKSRFKAYIEPPIPVGTVFEVLFLDLLFSSWIALLVNSTDYFMVENLEYL